MALCVERALVSAQLPARWQIHLQRWRSGGAPRRAIGCAEGEVAAIAKLRDAGPWNASSELRPGLVLGRSTDGAGILMTARVPLARVEALLADPRVLELEPAIPLRPLLDDAAVELGALPQLLPLGAAERLGAGAVIGVVDSGCDWRSQSVRERSGRPRIAAYWDQGAAARGDRRVEYGAVWDRAELALGQDASHASPAHDSHGTRLLDIAAGNGRAGGPAGVAPRADVLYVAMPSAARRGPARRGPSRRTCAIGDTVRLLEGAKFIFDQAGERPCALNVSVGTNAGSHDGTSLVEQALDALALAQPARAIIVAAGNGFAAEQHASGRVDWGESFDLCWHVPAGRRVRHAVEIWHSRHDQFDVELIAPRGQGQCRVAIGQNACLADERAGRLRAMVAHEESRAGNGDRVITIFIERGAPAGAWTARLVPRDLVDGRFHAWIEPEDDVRPAFITAAEPAGTLNSLACGFATLSVGAFEARRPELPAAWYSAVGPTRDGRPKPDASAPGHRVWAAVSGARETATECSGTSLAAAAAAGVAALVLAEADAAGVTLTAPELNQLLIETARRSHPSATADPRYGAGRLDAAAAVDQAHQLARRGVKTCSVAELVAESP